jgi:propanol-preferring alcohol dehydrogenase
MDDIPTLNYERDLFYGREIRSVTANTRGNGEAFLRFAADHHLRVITHEYPLAQAQLAPSGSRGGSLRRGRGPAHRRQVMFGTSVPIGV